MASLNKMPGYEAQLPRTPHDLSRDYHFTSSVGMQLPVFQHILNPSETVDLECSMFTRSNYLSTAAMAEIDFKIDWFFVPMQMLYTPFEQVFYGTDDFLSSASQQMYQTDSLGTLPLLDFMHSASSDFETLEAFQNFGAIAMFRYRLLMHLGLNPNSVFAHVARTVDGGIDNGNQPIYYNCKSPNVFPWQLLAYNAIHYKYYRLEDYERNDVQKYNLDRVPNGTPFTDGSIINLFNVPYYKDYFTSVKVSPIASLMSTIGSQLDVQNMLTTVNNYLNKTPVNALDSDQTYPPVSNFALAQLGSQDSFSTGNLRSVFAVEKLLRIFGRAGKTYDEQVLAHFGWKVPHDVKHQLTFLGSFDGSLDINQVLSTADTEISALGSIVGNGYGNVDGKKIRFTAPCHGVLMGIYYSRPKVVYEQSGFEKINAITSRLDFPQPEFDRLGMQPIYGFESNFKNIGSDIWNGWQFRNEQFKRKYDIASIAFADPNFSPVGRFSNNQFSAWVVAKRPLDLTNDVPVTSGHAFDESDLYVKPNQLDSITQVKMNADWSNDFFQEPWLMFQTDPFIHWLRVHCTLVSFMSKYGEPELD